MGSKTLHNDEHQKDDGPSTGGTSCIGGEPRGSHTARDGDGCVGSDGAAEDGDEDDDIHANSTTSTLKSLDASAGIKKKKRKRSKKKTKTSTLKQSSPPRIPLDDLYPANDYPTGEFLDYSATSQVRSSEKAVELRYDDRCSLEDDTLLMDYRKAAEVHRQVRHWVQESVKPGQTLTEIAVGIEDGVRALLDNTGLEPGQNLRAGIAFPTGLALNHCVAHYTPNPGFKEIVLQHQDVMKVDFGVQINGWIVDSAFTLSFDPMYDNLLAAVKDATNTGIKTAGIDVRISDVSAAIQEAMESYEVEIRGKVYPVKPVRNLCGHNIKPYRIHGGKSIPFIKNSDQTKMEENEVFAIETFGSTGRGYIRDDQGIYGYGLSDDAPDRITLPLSSANRVYRTIKGNFGSLVFCRRYLERLGCERYLVGLNSLVSNGILESHQPLVDVSGSYSAQFEHTILLRESKKEVISRGEDY